MYSLNADISIFLGPINKQVGKIAKLRQMCNEAGVNPWIEVDGGVTPDNAYKVRREGADIFWRAVLLASWCC